MTPLNLDEEADAVDDLKIASAYCRESAATRAGIAAASGHEWRAAIVQHVERYIGAVEGSFHPDPDDRDNSEILHIAPTAARPVHTFVTSGASRARMSVPPRIQCADRAELCMVLPSEWPLEDLAHSQWNWPLRLLAAKAREPIQQRSWLGWGQSAGHYVSGELQAFDASTEQSCSILLPHVGVDDGFSELKPVEGVAIEFLCLVPLYLEELQLKIRDGIPELLARLDRYGVTEVVSPRRRNVALSDAAH